MHREPDVGFDPGSPGSRPGPKAGAKPLRHPGIPKGFFFEIGMFELGAALVAQWFSAAFRPGRDPGDLGLGPAWGSLRGTCFSLCLDLCFSLSLSLSHMNK